MNEDLPGDERAKRDRLARITNVINILQQHGGDGVSPNEIAKRTGVARRTVYRDLDAIQDELGLPVWSERGRWGMDGTAFLPPLRLTLPEALAVFTSARLMTRFADSHDPSLTSAYTKLLNNLPPNMSRVAERSLRELVSRPVDAEINRVTADLAKAWAERRTVQFVYTPAAYNGGEPQPRQARVRPYLLEPSLQTHALYLIGWDEDRNAMRTFKVDRISAVSLLPTTFADPEEDVILQLRRAWDIITDQPNINVVLRFAPAVCARVQEATWHPTQQVEELPDGSLEWRGTVSGPHEIRLWILSWGADVEVLEPASLRDDVAGILHRAAQQYTA